MRRRYTEIQTLGGVVVGISFESRDRLFQMSRQMQLPFPVLSDPEKDTYRAYGLSSGKLRRIFGPGTIWAYVKLLAAGQTYHFRSSDFLQLGGDFVIDAAGTVRYEYRSGAPHYRTSVDQIIAVLGEI